jgi:hypothetical protein
VVTSREGGARIERRLADLRRYDGKIATILWDAPEGEQADRGRLAVHGAGAVEIRDPDTDELRLSLGWRAVQRVLDVYEDLRDDVRFRHLKLTRVGAGRDGSEIYLTGATAGGGHWRIIQGWDGLCARADVWHRYKAPTKSGRYISTHHSLDEVLDVIDREATALVSRSPTGSPPGHG